MTPLLFHPTRRSTLEARPRRPRTARGGGEVLDDLLGDDLRRRQRAGVGQRLVLDVGPDVEVEAGALSELLVGPALEVLGLLALAERLARLVGVDEARRGRRASASWSSA